MNQALLLRYLAALAALVAGALAVWKVWDLIGTSAPLQSAALDQLKRLQEEVASARRLVEFESRDASGVQGLSQEVITTTSQAADKLQRLEKKLRDLGAKIEQFRAALVADGVTREVRQAECLKDELRAIARVLKRDFTTLSYHVREQGSDSRELARANHVHLMSEMDRLTQNVPVDDASAGSDVVEYYFDDDEEENKNSDAPLKEFLDILGFPATGTTTSKTSSGGSK